MEKQVLSISQMEELISLGIDTSEASMCWYQERIDEESGWMLEQNLFDSKWIKDHPDKYCPTFTLQDILEILPKPCYINCIDEDFYQCEVTTNNGSLSTNGKTAIAAVFNMLKCCKQK